MFTVDFSQYVTAKGSTSFDFAALFDFESLHGTLDAFHLWHWVSFLFVSGFSPLFLTVDEAEKWGYILSEIRLKQY
jgi:hypothetical protein